MALKTPSETPRTVAAGILTLIAVLAMTGALSSALSWIGWKPGLSAVGWVGYPLMFLLYGACATVLLHHLTHHPSGVLKYLTQVLLAVYGVWALMQGVGNAAAMILGIGVGFLWLHLFHRVGRKERLALAGQIPDKKLAKVRGRRR